MIPIKTTIPATASNIPAIFAEGARKRVPADDWGLRSFTASRRFSAMTHLPKDEASIHSAGIPSPFVTMSAGPPTTAARPIKA
jgi:hypothetical protein